MFKGEIFGSRFKAISPEMMTGPPDGGPASVESAQERQGDLWLLVCLGEDRDPSLLNDLISREACRLRCEIGVENPTSSSGNVFRTHSKIVDG